MKFFVLLTRRKIGYEIKANSNLTMYVFKYNNPIVPQQPSDIDTLSPTLRMRKLGYREVK